MINISYTSKQRLFLWLLLWFFSGKALEATESLSQPQSSSVLWKKKIDLGQQNEKDTKGDIVYTFVVFKHFRWDISNLFQEKKNQDYRGCLKIDPIEGAISHYSDNPESEFKGLLKTLYHYLNKKTHNQAFSLITKTKAIAIYCESQTYHLFDPTGPSLKLPEHPHVLIFDSPKKIIEYIFFRLSTWSPDIYSIDLTKLKKDKLPPFSNREESISLSDSETTQSSSDDLNDLFDSISSKFTSSLQHSKNLNGSTAPQVEEVHHSAEAIYDEIDLPLKDYGRLEEEWEKKHLLASLLDPGFKPEQGYLMKILARAQKEETSKAPYSQEISKLPLLQKLSEANKPSRHLDQLLDTLSQKEPIGIILSLKDRTRCLLLHNQSVFYLYHIAKNNKKPPSDGKLLFFRDKNEVWKYLNNKIDVSSNYWEDKRFTFYTLSGKFQYIVPNSSKSRTIIPNYENTKYDKVYQGVNYTKRAKKKLSKTPIEQHQKQENHNPLQEKEPNDLIKSTYYARRIPPGKTVHNNKRKKKNDPEASLIGSGGHSTPEDQHNKRRKKNDLEASPIGSGGHNQPSPSHRTSHIDNHEDQSVSTLLGIIGLVLFASYFLLSPSTKKTPPKDKSEQKCHKPSRSHRYPS